MNEEGLENLARGTRPPWEDHWRILLTGVHDLYSWCQLPRRSDQGHLPLKRRCHLQELRCPGLAPPMAGMQTLAQLTCHIPHRGHWCIENSCHYIIDWNYHEDRSRIRTGHGPENITRLRRFAISIIKSKGVRSVAQKMRQLMLNVRLVFDYLRMTENSCAGAFRN